MAEPKVPEPACPFLQIDISTPTDPNGSKEGGGRRAEESMKMIGAIRTKSGFIFWVLVLTTYLSLSVGFVSSTLLSKFYFLHGGSRRWVSTLVQSVGFPLLFIPLAFSYGTNPPPSSSSTRPFSCLTPRVLLSTIVLGLLLGFDTFLYAWGISYLSASVSSLLLSSKLAFTALFSGLIVKQPMNFPTLNCIILLMLSSGLVGNCGNHEKPSGVTNSQYALRIVSTIGAAAFFGLYLPLLQLLNDHLRKRKLGMSFRLLIETQILVFASATVFSFVGMLIAGDFGRIKAESVDFDVGGLKYWLCLVFSAVAWMMAYIGTAGLILLTSSLMCGISTAALIPVGVVAPLVFFHEPMNPEKGFAMAMSMWAFCSYLFGEFKQRQRTV